MRKIRKLSLFGILGVVIAVLFLISISFTQAQVQIQDKPDNPGKPDKNGEEDTWAVELPEGPPPEIITTMLYGDGAMYTNNDTGVTIKVEKGKSMVRVDGKRQIVFYYYFCFKLVNPTLRYVSFQGVELTTKGVPEIPYCIFPGECGLTAPFCMECFLNRHQPYRDLDNEEDNYEYFYLKFQVGQHSFTDVFGDSIDGIEDMLENIPVKFISYSDWIKIRVQNQEDFSYPYTDYHNVECDERNYDDKDLKNMNIWIKRLDTNKWRIYVGYDPYEGSTHPGADLLFQEQYTARVTGKKGKGGKTETVVPLEATGNFSFYIDFIKNPSTDGTG